MSDALQVAEALRVGLSLLLRRIKQVPVDGELTLPEHSALVRLDRGGPATSSELAKQEQISPQSMGAILAPLEARGLIERSPDPADRRRILLALSDAGRQVLLSRRSARTEALAKAMSGFTDAELEQIMAVAPLFERLAENL